MTAATATPQQMRDRLLQAIDGQSNQICNMVAVMEVISYLEKYPITKETLEETRLGKLINDVRKKTKDEDLAKRAKKLLRNWQKLIEPGQSEVSSKGHSNMPGSANGGTYPCRTDISPPAATPPSGKTVPELKNRNDFNNCYSPKTEKSANRKRKGEQRDGQHLPVKIPKTTANDKVHNSSRPTNGIIGGPEAFTDMFDVPSDKDIVAEHLESDRLNKIPVNAVKPHPSSQGLGKPPSTSALLKAAVLQQQARLEQAASGGGHCQPKSPRSSSHSPRTSKQELVARQPALSAPKVSTLSSPTQSTTFSGMGSSPLPSPQPLTQSVQVSHPDRPPVAESSFHWEGLADSDPHLQHSNRISSSPVETLHNSKSLSLSKGVKIEDDDSVNITGKKKRNKYRPRDYTVNLDGQPTEESTKPVRLKDRRLTFDPVTGQIKPLSHKESYQESEVTPAPVPLEPHRTETPKPSPCPQNLPVTPSPFQQTNWKELSRNEIIQSYLNRQSNVLTSSGAQTPGAHFFMTEYLKQEEDHVKEARKKHTLAPTIPDAQLPGVDREVTSEDLVRIHKEHWPGVNGCYDTKDKWYNWTECISLDPHGDESKLNILPYICLD
ncbi:mediator of RNA polymerase II transcription subunit 26-like isoform X1 [Hypomesus transpacificus]|uniref:mediator of RNA polymerase II transcription subunit 26-like isoform X1 n=1 Tax=Hypomesus transpacificus TaxID=137520 RepID=UPI001F074D10|nr:mediator of RNA polymerase II transcription subunit 26-like isoform X1 [Hypomesus transpacificus]XP_046906228.1 mediator of RNA polymerase II transcription subunit 26-like isoform X1 [Hypomesus transpacificus]